MQRSLQLELSKRTGDIAVGEFQARQSHESDNGIVLLTIYKK